MNPSVLFQEINEQPDALARFLDTESANVERIAAEINRHKPSYLTIAARGSSDNAATFAKYIFASFNGLPVALATPSLYSIYKSPPRLVGSLVIAISQSGESPDILAVLEEAKRQQVPALALTNSADSPLARAANWVILQHAGEEKTIAATKTYTTQLAALALLSVMLANDRARRRDLEAIPDAVARALALDSAVEQAAARRRDWLSIRLRIFCLPSPTMRGGRRTAAATNLKSMTTSLRSSPAKQASTRTRSQISRAAAMARSISSSVSSPTATPLPCSPRAGFTTTLPCFLRKAFSALASSSATICSGTTRPAFSTTRRVTALSSQMDIATPEVSSERLSRQWTERPPCERRKKPPSASVISTCTPRLCASSTMSRA